MVLKNRIKTGNRSIRHLIILMIFFCTTLHLKADSTTMVAYNIRLSSSFAGLNNESSTDTVKQYTFNVQNIFYYNVKHISFGIGTGFENSMFYVSDKKSFYRAYEAPVFLSVKLNSTDEKAHVFQNFGIALPVKSKLPDIGPGYYFQTGFGFGTRQIKLELSYKLITLLRDKGPLLNNNFTFGLCFNVK